MSSASARAKTEDNFYRRAQLEELLREDFPPLTVLEGEDGTRFEIDNPMALSDETVEAVELAGDRQVAIARAYLDAHMGEGTYDGAFKEAGGQSKYVMHAIKRESDRVTGVVPGSGAPTR